MSAKLVLAVIAGFFVTSFAAAQSGASPDRITKMDRHFSYTDTNGDGFIARDEAGHYPALIKHFGVIDSNKDGRLSREEMQAYRLGTNGKQRTANAGRKSRVSEDEGDAAVTKADAAETSAARRKNY